MHDDDKTQNQWGRSGDDPWGWRPNDFTPESDRSPAAGSQGMQDPFRTEPPPSPSEPAQADLDAGGPGGSNAETPEPAPAPEPAQPAPPPAQPWQPAPPPAQPAGQPWQPAPPPAQPWAPPAQPWGAPPPRPWPPQPGQAPGWQQNGSWGWGSQQPWPPQPGQPQGWPPAPGQPQGWQPAPGQPQGWQSGPTPTWPPAPPSAPTGAATSAAAVKRPSRLPQLLTIVAACLISFSAGMATDRLVFGQPEAAAPTATTSTDTPLQNFSLYEQALQIIRKNYVGNSGITDQQLLYGSIRGMVEALGDTGHSVFLTPEEYQASQSELSGNIAGVGILIGTDNGMFTVTRVLPSTPAAEAGVKAGDQITQVDGESVAGLSFDVFASKIRGQAGTKVTITVVRPGVADPIDITMTRAVISVPLVSWGMVPGTSVADIGLFEFSLGASDQLASAIQSATDAGATGIVLDLRGNPGGYATEAVDVASQFISTGTVYYTEDANGHRTSNDVNTSVPHTSLPLVVLVDHDSASAAEIVAGALQDSKRGTIVGESTFGTGTVLEAFKLKDGSAILLGVAYWLTPNGNKIFGKGITPDQEVALPSGVTPLDPDTLSSMTAAQLNASGDAELLAAVKDLTQ
jgi:carboxyl-terminal processing protease